MDDLVKHLACVLHFAHLTGAELCAIVGQGQTRRVPGETVLFVEGQPSAGCPRCWKVACPCESSAPLDGRQPSLEPVIMFNEGAALEQGANPVTVTAARSAEGSRWIPRGGERRCAPVRRGRWAYCRGWPGATGPSLGTWRMCPSAPWRLDRSIRHGPADPGAQRCHAHLLQPGLRLPLCPGREVRGKGA
jgi:hypothetical protein